MTAKVFLRDQLLSLSQEYDVQVVANEQDIAALRKVGVPLDVTYVAIDRSIRFSRDLRALWRLYRFFRLHKFHLVHSVTPKAGLLTAVSAWLARVPIRVHTFTGQVWVTRRGMMRRILKTADWLIASLNTVVLADSKSQRAFLVDEGVVPAPRCELVANGSISGVDTRRFRPDHAVRTSVRGELGVSDDQVLVLFLGRVTRDKGMLDLARAFRSIHRRNGRARLLVVGPDEEDIVPVMQGILAESGNALLVRGYTDVPEQLMQAADVFCLPSYREGFGTVIIEAAACGTPSVASRIYGITDAVEDGVTGILHDPGNIGELEDALETMINDGGLRGRFGESALRRAEELYSMEHVTDAMMKFYSRHLAQVTGGR